jgi:hypothetical protein
MAGSGYRGSRGSSRNGRGSGPTPAPRPLSESAPRKAGDPTPPTPAAQQSSKCAATEGPPPEAFARLAKMEERLNDLASAIPGHNQQLTDISNPDDNPEKTPLSNRMYKLEMLFNKLISVMETISDADEERENQSKEKQDYRPAKPPSKKRQKYVPFDYNCNLVQTYTRFFSITFEAGKKRLVTPYSIKNQITTVTGKPPKSITSNGRDSLTILVEDDMQSNKMKDITMIDDISCKTEKHPYFNQSKGIIYIREYDVDNIEEFRCDLMEN